MSFNSSREEILSHSAANHSSPATSTTLCTNHQPITTTTFTTSTESFLLTSTEFNNVVGEKEEQGEGERHHEGETKQNMPPATLPDMFEINAVNLILRNLAIETSVGIFTIIFSFLDIPENYERFLLRRLCRAFRLVLKATVPPGMFTTFPHPNYPTLNGLMDVLNRVYQNDPSKAPKIVFVMKGTFHIYANNPRVNINYPMIMIGAGQNKTNLSGYCLRIGGTKEKGKNVRMQDITMVRSSGDGLYGYNGLFFLCTRMTFTQCGGDVVSERTTPKED